MAFVRGTAICAGGGVAARATGAEVTDANRVPHQDLHDVAPATHGDGDGMTGTAPPPWIRFVVRIWLVAVLGAFLVVQVAASRTMHALVTRLRAG